MLIRLVINNFLSFGEEREFNMLPNERYAKLPHHKYAIGPISVLKLAAIYGANAAGKSNMIKALKLLKTFVNQKKLPTALSEMRFRFDDELRDRAITLVIEFWAGDKAFLYGVELCDDFVLTEELYESGLGEKADRLIFQKQQQDGKQANHVQRGIQRKAGKPGTAIRARKESAEG